LRGNTAADFHFLSSPGQNSRTEKPAAFARALADAELQLLLAFRARVLSQEIENGD